MKSYTTVAGPCSVETVIKKSRFIGQIYPVRDMEDAQNVLSSVKKKYWDARHSCSAIVTGDSGEYTRCSDDGEPQGTAGVPILETVKKSGLTNVLCVVTRYFGGVLLGASGLLRAYTKSAADACASAEKEYHTVCDVCRAGMSFRSWGKTEQVIYGLGGRIKDIEYGENVTVTVYLPSGTAGKFVSAVSEATAGTAVCDLLGEEMYVSKQR